MKKNLKFTANELFDSFNKDFNQDEMNEIYKALIAYSLNLQEITPEIDAKLDEVINYINAVLFIYCNTEESKK